MPPPFPVDNLARRRFRLCPLPETRYILRPTADQANPCSRLMIVTCKQLGVVDLELATSCH